MSLATITPQRSGRAIFELNGVCHEFANWQAASREADARGLRWFLEPFPPLSPEVQAVAPAMRVLS